jgi:hypothetical protein
MIRRLGQRIAVVGWGSLIWDPRQLPLRLPWHPDGTPSHPNRSPWHSDGPELPVELARVSRDGRLTLALRQGVADVQTLWAVMSCGTLDEARHHLARRERTDPGQIGSLDCSGDARVDSLDLIHGAAVPALASWLSERDLDAVVWTGLPSNFEERTGEPLGVDAAVRYLDQQSGDTRLAAEQYVRRAPAQVGTDIRRGLERRLGWTAALDAPSDGLPSPP